MSVRSDQARDIFVKDASATKEERIQHQHDVVEREINQPLRPYYESVSCAGRQAGKLRVLVGFKTQLPPDSVPDCSRASIQ